MVHPLGLVNSRWDPLLEDLGAYKSQKSQALWGNKGLTSRKSRKPFGEPRGIQVAQVANPLGDQRAYKSQSLKPFWGPRSSHVAGFFEDQGAYKSQKSQALYGTKGLTCRKPFRGPRGLQVAKSQAL